MPSSKSSSSEPDERELVALGTIARAQGIRGDVRLALYNPESELWETLERVVVRSKNGETKIAEILERRPGPKGSLVVRLDLAADRSAAEALAGAEVCVAASELAPLEEGEIYERDIPGLEVRDRDGRRIGVVESVLNYPTVACIRVRSDEGVREIPLRDPWVVLVDLEAGAITTGDLDDIPFEGR